MMDEIYMLRAHCAREALRLRSYASANSVSKSRRKELVEAAERLERASQGDAEAAWDASGPTTRAVLQFAGADDSLNYPRWKAERDRQHDQNVVG